MRASFQIKKNDVESQRPLSGPEEKILRLETKEVLAHFAPHDFRPRLFVNALQSFCRSLDTEFVFQNQKKFAHARHLSRYMNEQCLSGKQKAFFFTRFNPYATAKALIT